VPPARPRARLCDGGARAGPRWASVSEWRDINELYLVGVLDVSLIGCEWWSLPRRLAERACLNRMVAPAESCRWFLRKSPKWDGGTYLNLRFPMLWGLAEKYSFEAPVYFGLVRNRMYCGSLLEFGDWLGAGAGNGDFDFLAWFLCEGRPFDLKIPELWAEQEKECRCGLSTSG